MEHLVEREMDDDATHLINDDEETRKFWPGGLIPDVGYVNGTLLRRTGQHVRAPFVSQAVPWIRVTYGNPLRQALHRYINFSSSMKPAVHGDREHQRISNNKSEYKKQEKATYSKADFQSGILKASLGQILVESEILQPYMCRDGFRIPNVAFSSVTNISWTHQTKSIVPSAEMSLSVTRTDADVPSPLPALPKNRIVVGCGMICMDYLATVAAYPKPDDKIRCTNVMVQGGGNVGNALTCAARLGLTPRLISKVLRLSVSGLNAD
ncbi:hypothetical protein ACLOJK_011193 [Asimina triloba]